jgi:ketosteroid isomerase-like protein
MSVDLSAPIAAYFETRNAFDVEAILAPFHDDAIVIDEDQEYRGRAAIRAWVEETTRKYHAKVEPKAAQGTNGEFVVSALVSGDFPGSPILLDHAFTLSGQKIARLEIG